MVEFARRSVRAGVTKYLSCALVFTDLMFLGKRSELFPLFTHFLTKFSERCVRLSRKVVRPVSSRADGYSL